MNEPNLSKTAVSAMFVVALTLSPFALAHDPAEHGKENLSAGAEKSVTGEIVDMMCYVDHNAVGETHGQSCGAKCIKGGGPVGIVSDSNASRAVAYYNPSNEHFAHSYCKT